MRFQESSWAKQAVYCKMEVRAQVSSGLKIGRVAAGLGALVNNKTPSPRFFSELHIPKGFKCFVLKLRILKGLRVYF